MPLKPKLGRDSAGKFVKGHKSPGPGNPLGSKVLELRRALVAAVSPKDIEKIAKQLVSSAIGGDVAASKLLFSYIFGAPISIDVMEKIDELEATLKTIEKTA